VSVGAKNYDVVAKLTPVPPEKKLDWRKFVLSYGIVANPVLILFFALYCA
jgi:hypothetical protein